MNDWTLGIATSKIFHPNLALFRNGIAEGYYALNLDKLVLFIAWMIVLYAAFSGLYRMAAGSPRGVKQVMMVAAAGLLLGLTPKIRGTSVGDVGLLWGFYHGVYSQLYEKGALTKLATADIFKQTTQQQINAFKTLVRFEAEIALLRTAMGFLGGVRSVRNMTKVATKFNPLLSALNAALDELEHQIDKITNELEKQVDAAVQGTVWAAVHMIEVNTFFIYITAAMVIFVSLFWPLVAAWLVFPSTMKASITGGGMVLGATLGMVIAGPTMLTGLAVVFSTASTALNQYQATIAKSTEEIRETSENLKNTLKIASDDVSKGTEMIDGGLRILEAARQKIAQNVQAGGEAKTTMARVCKLEIKKAKDTDAFPGLSELDPPNCIGGMDSQSNPNLVTQAEVEEYISNYKQIEAELTQKLADLTHQAEGLNVGLMDKIANGLLGIITRFQIQLNIAVALSWIISAAILLFVGLVVALGVNVSGNFVLNRLRR